jgi:hypothetical protein
LLDDLQSIRGKWHAIWSEAVLVAESLEMSIVMPRTGKRQLKRKRFADESLERHADHNTQLADTKTNEQISDNQESTSDSANFRISVFYKLLDSVIIGLTTRFDAAKHIDSLFGFLYKYQTMTEEELTSCTERFCKEYENDVSADLTAEMILLRNTSNANIGERQLAPLNLLNKLHETCLQTLFPNVCISLRIFCTLPVTVASAERSFSNLNRIKTYARSTMAQERLQGLALLCIESDVARNINYDSVIDAFAARKDRKAAL